MHKYDNLLNRLRSQIDPSDKSLNKNLKISNLGRVDDETTVRDLFNNPIRIQSITMGDECGV